MYTKKQNESSKSNDEKDDKNLKKQDS